MLKDIKISKYKILFSAFLVLMIFLTSYIFSQADEFEYSLSILKKGTGNGTIISDPLGIDCGSDCEYLFEYGTEVTLTAIASENNNFVSWFGDCSGESTTCTVTVDQAKDVAVEFNLIEANSFSGGDGSSLNPYQIETLEQLNLVRNYLKASFILIDNIDAQDTETWDNEKGWESIGDSDYASRFRGTFDGMGTL